MTLVSVIETQPYLADAKRLTSEEERAAIVDTIASHPDAGAVVRGTGGLRKLRIALRGRGKRGGGRVIYWYHSEDSPAVLLAVFAKNEASELPIARWRLLEHLAAEVAEDFRCAK